MVKVILVDDDYLFLECLERTLTSDFTDFRVVGKMAINADLVTKVGEMKPDVVVMGMPDRCGVEAIEALSEKFPNIKVIVLSMSKDEQNLVRAIQAGVSAYLLKTCSIQELAESIFTVMSGTYVLTPSMSGKLMEAFKRKSQKVQRNDIYSLSEREKEILQFAAMGASNKEIAKRCFISEATVKSHFHNILFKMDIRNRAGAVALATSSGILTRLHSNNVVGNAAYTSA